MHLLSVSFKIFFLRVFQESKLTKEQKKAKDIQDTQKKDNDEVRKLKVENENLLSDLDDVKDTVARVSLFLYSILYTVLYNTENVRWFIYK